MILEDKNGRVLLQKRADNHMWGYAGGSVELDEKVEDAAKRELFEETGLIANSLELFGVFSGEEQHYTYPNGDEVSTIDIVYICRKYSGKMKMQPEEVTELKFFDIDCIPEDICPPVREPIKKYIEYRHRDAIF